MLDIQAYVSWLEGFTLRHKFFKDTDWWRDNLSIMDKTNITNIREFFKEIEKIAKRYSISPIADDYGYHYYFKHNNIGYKIGVGQTYSSYYYCERKKISNNAKFISLTSITSDDLNILADTVTRLVDSNIPIETIVETFNNALAKHKKKE